MKVVINALSQENRFIFADLMNALVRASISGQEVTKRGSQPLKIMFKTLDNMGTRYDQDMIEI